MSFVHSDDILASQTIITEIVEILKINNTDSIYGDLDYVSIQDTSKKIRQWKLQVSLLINI